MNPIELEIARNLFESISEEMGNVLMRAAFSSNIRERLDFSCALFDRRGEMVAQAAHIPVHLGSTPASVRAAIESLDIVEGGDIILNDPYHGGTHLPDITLVRPIFLDGELVMFACNRAHHADVGGKVPGSMGITEHLSDEGFVLEPQYFSDALAQEISAQSWTPRERLGDLRSQVAANNRAERRVIELLDRRPDLIDGMSDLQTHSERMMRETLRKIGTGDGFAEDVLDDDGAGTTNIKIACTVSIVEGQATIDFSGSDPQCAGPLNVPKAVTDSAVYYVFRCLAPDVLPTNGGYMRCIDVKTVKGTIVDAEFPRPVALGNVETSQRIVDVVFQALAPLLSNDIPACSYGSMNNVVFSGEHDGTRYAYYETIGGGAGASSMLDGGSAVQCHMTNTLNTPIESLERDFPVLISRYGIRRETGGAGRRRGGDGIIRAYTFLHPTTVCVMGERRVMGPRGTAGGEPGEVAVASLNGASLPPKSCFQVSVGDELIVETAGGGGWGSNE